MTVRAARRNIRTTGIATIAVVLAISALVPPGRASGAVARSTSARHWTATCPAPYPLSQVHAGLTGTGWTTVHGTDPQPFAVRVLGVLHDGIAPGIDMIVIAAHSSAIKHNGTWEGMSGSPIYASDGRLIGALSYGISLGATNKAGVTPAAAMYQLLSDHNAPPAAYAKRVALPGSMRAAAAPAVGSGAASGDLQLLPTPITVTGLPTAKFSELRQRLEADGAAPFSLHAGGAKGVQRHGSAESIRPGAPFGVTIAYGDYTIGGVGTVTAVCGHKVLAFGHPMMLAGATTETANAARVLYVQRDPTGSSFVMANVGHVIGTLDQDRVPGVRATLGARPRATTITTHVSAPGTGLHRSGVTRTSLVDEVADAAGGSTYGSLIATAQDEGAGSVSYSLSATGRLIGGKRWSYHRTDLFTDPFDVEYGTSFQIYETLATITGNPFDAVSVSKVTVHATARQHVAEWELHSLSVNQDGAWQDVTPTTTLDVAPGDDVKVRALLWAYRDSHKTRTVELTVHIPESAGGGSGQIQVLGGGDVAEQGPDTSTVTSFGQLMKVLNALPHSADVVAQLTVPDPTGTTTITKTHHVRLKQLVRGAFTLPINVDVPCGDCGGDGGGGDGGGDPVVS